MKDPIPKRVPKAAFRSLVRWAPTVSIDLIFLNRANEVLLGYRSNRPAKDTWFVPGGRIFKGERIADAMVRIARDRDGNRNRSLPGANSWASSSTSTGTACSAPRASLPTHYVVLAFRIRLRKDPRLHADSQHRELRWFSPGDVLRYPNRPREHEGVFPRQTKQGGRPLGPYLLAFALSGSKRAWKKRRYSGS